MDTAKKNHLDIHCPVTETWIGTTCDADSTVSCPDTGIWADLVVRSSSPDKSYSVSCVLALMSSKKIEPRERKSHAGEYNGDGVPLTGAQVDSRELSQIQDSKASHQE
jgi:hypothetical protein